MNPFQSILTHVTALIGRLTKHSSKATLGRRGELLAARWLENQGHEVLSWRYRSKLGELDLVTQNGDTLHIVEVKTRRIFNPSLTPDLVVSPKQEQRIARSGLHFWRNNLPLRRRRGLTFLSLDVMIVSLPEPLLQRPQFAHFTNCLNTSGH